MRKEGIIIRWEAERGFGFIRAPGGSADAFLHVRECHWPDGQVPREGLRVTFEELHFGGKRPRAVAVQVADGRAARVSAAPVRRTSRRSPEPSGGARLMLPLMVAYGALLGWAVWQRQLPAWVLAASLGLNLLTFFAYWQDKYAAQQRHWRVPEQTLHLCSLAGGWAGAWFAQQVLRHKSRKASFRAGYALTVVVHCAALGAWWWYVRGL